MQRINNPRAIVLLVLLIVALAVVGYLLKDPEEEQADIAREIAPCVLFTLGPLQVTSTVVNTWAMMLLISTAVIIVGCFFKVRPGPVQNALEWLVEAIKELIRKNVGIADPSVFLPIIGTLAVFVGAANLIGLLPGLQCPTPDINTPLAVALIVFFSVHYYGIRTRGLLRYLKHYVEPIFLMLPIEIASEIARTFSLTFRLFGNILGEEIIISILFIVVPFVVPVPMQLFSIFTGLLQAYIFTLLTCVYIGGAIKAHQ